MCASLGLPCSRCAAGTCRGQRARLAKTCHFTLVPWPAGECKHVKSFYHSLLLRGWCLSITLAPEEQTQKL